MGAGKRSGRGHGPLRPRRRRASCPEARRWRRRRGTRGADTGPGAARRPAAVRSRSAGVRMAFPPRARSGARATHGAKEPKPPEQRLHHGLRPHHVRVATGIRAGGNRLPVWAGRGGPTSAGGAGGAGRVGLRRRTAAARRIAGPPAPPAGCWLRSGVHAGRRGVASRGRRNGPEPRVAHTSSPPCWLPKARTGRAVRGSAASIDALSASLDGRGARGRTEEDIGGETAAVSY